MEVKQAGKKAEEISSECAAAFKAQVFKRKLIEGIKEKIQQEKLSFKNGRRSARHAGPVQEEKRKDKSN